MAIVTTDSKHYSDIADAIREKTGEATTYKPEEMPAGVVEVYESGKQSEYDTFWDAFQNNGNRTNYQYAFQSPGWNANNLKPKYDMHPKNADYMFTNFPTNVDFVEQLNGVVLDFSQATAMRNLFSGAYITRIGVVDTRSCTTLNNLFGYCSNLRAIDKLILKEDGSQSFTNLFISPTNVTNITIEGVIGKNGFNIGACIYLSKDSVTSIVNALSTTTTGLTVTISASAKAKFTDEEWAALIATKPNWTIALA